jgi:hypothetical protein
VTQKIISEQNLGGLPNHFRKGIAMLSGDVGPACRRRLSSIRPRPTGALIGRDATGPLRRPILICGYDAPHRRARSAVPHATIYPIANRVTTTGREPFLATTQTRVGTKGTPDWPSSIAVN